MVRSRLSARIISSFIKEGKRQTRISDPVLVAPMMKTIFGVQKFANGGSLDHTTMELVKIRASQLNSCAFCLSMHWRDALKAGERPDRLATVSAWRETDWFTAREQAALAWTEAITALTEHGASDELWEACREVYSEQEMIDLTAEILAINNWNRMNAAFGTLPEPFALEDVVSR